jgi:hypothetical protein
VVELLDPFPAHHPFPNLRGLGERTAVSIAEMSAFDPNGLGRYAAARLLLSLKHQKSKAKKQQN